MREVIRDRDMFALDTGHILTSYGNYEGDLIRGRLSYAPDETGDRTVGGRRFSKVTFHRWPAIPATSLLLDHPGEQQYLVPRSRIQKIYPPLTGPPSNREVAAWADEVRSSPAADLKKLYVHGGQSLGSWVSESSDTDFIAYAAAIDNTRRVIMSHSAYADDWNKISEISSRKYQHYIGLQGGYLQFIFRRKWHLFRVNGQRASIGFVDPNLRADGFIRPEAGPTIVTRGRIKDGNRSHFLPVVITIADEQGCECDLVAWPYLYLGGFLTGDLVEARGRLIGRPGRQALVVERSDEYIRVLAERTGDAGDT